MKRRWMMGLGVGLWLCAFASADTIMLNGGGRVQGVINKLESGKVYIEVAGSGVREIPLGEVASVNFDTPHLTVGPGKDFDTQELNVTARDLNQARRDARTALDKAKGAFAARQSGEKDRWNAAKETFQVPLARYRELVGDLYRQVLAQVDGYNNFVKEADQTRGLVPGDFWERAVKESVPENWYDRIYFDGYNRGYKEGSEFERLSRVPQACEATR